MARKPINLVCIQQLVFLMLFFVSGYVVAQKLEFQEKNEGILLLENDVPRYFYRTDPGNNNSEFARVNYLHPLYGLDEEVLTEDFPKDHPHHHGIFWAWHQLYAEGKRIADRWLNEGITWRVVHTKTKINEKKAILFAEIEWIQEKTDSAVIKENLVIDFKLTGDVPS